MYQLTDSVLTVKGIGDSVQQALGTYDLHTVLDFLLFLPLRYEDRRQLQSVAAALQLGEAASTDFLTIRASLTKWREYRKGRLLIGRATITDTTGSLNCLWFNNKFLKNKLRVGQSYFFSGKIKGNQLMQATVEKVDESEDASAPLHTGRLVPIYPKLGELKQGQIRRLMAEIIGKLHQAGELATIFHNLHFPDQTEEVVTARERLALEELIFQLAKANEYKQIHLAHKIQPSLPATAVFDTNRLPFTLTTAQTQAAQEIMADLQKDVAMNRLLVGDVGSGKTIVAALPAVTLVQHNHNVCLLAPTKILAKQHYDKLRQLFPHTSIKLVHSQVTFQPDQQATLYIGTHNLINKLTDIKPTLVIYDEQQRFGVVHRQISQSGAHVLNMTATPIPRSLMLSIFSHLELSYLDQMPNQRQIATTWFVPPHKQEKAIEWLVTAIQNAKKQQQHKQALIVCPFINPSSYQATENVAAVQETATWLEKYLQKLEHSTDNSSTPLTTAILHSQLTKKVQDEVIAAMYDQQIDILISTPMVEVGVDLPNADIMVIQSAERFGLSSLHQLRGRVGRQGQESHCLLFSTPTSTKKTYARLQQFCHEKDGLKLAQIDLEQRGAGNLLGHQQSGLRSLRFAAWTNLTLIEQAQQTINQDTKRRSLLTDYLEQITTTTITTATN